MKSRADEVGSVARIRKEAVLSALLWIHMNLRDEPRSCEPTRRHRKKGPLGRKQLQTSRKDPISRALLDVLGESMYTGNITNADVSILF